MNSYLIVIEKARRNYSAFCPDIPGCIATGKTLRETERLMREALTLHLETMREYGDPIPPPMAFVSRIRVAV